MPSRSDFDRLWMNLAYQVAHMSHDPSTKVGAVVVLDDRQVSVGYNGMPAGVPEPEWLWERPTKYDGVIHAEVNAVINAPFETRGSTVYVTLQPCPGCLGKLINAGVRRIVWGQPYANLTATQIKVWKHFATHFDGEVVQYEQFH